MALTLLRHTTPAVAPGTCYGMTDLALADTFAAEAQGVLAGLPDGITRIVASPLTRCQRLATVVSQARGLPLSTDPNWREMDFGAWEGTAWDAIPRAEIDAWAADFMGYAGHGGESVADLRARVASALEAAPENALIVTHSGCVRAAMAIREEGEGWETEIPFGGWLRV